MKTTIHCITLRIIKHSDTTSIVTVWSRECGRLAIAVPAGGGREARRRRALMMPFSLFAAETDVREGREMVRVHDVRPWGCGNVASTDPLRNITAMFLADFLSVVLRESQPDPLLTDFISYAAECLGTVGGAALANFHLWFMIKLGVHLGISPDYGTYARGRCFDMREGIFTITAPTHRNFIIPTQARLLHTFAEAHIGTLGMIRITRADRNMMLDRVLEYYTLHHAPVNALPSLQIVRDVLR